MIQTYTRIEFMVSMKYQQTREKNDELHDDKVHDTIYHQIRLLDYMMNIYNLQIDWFLLLQNKIELMKSLNNYEYLENMN